VNVLYNPYGNCTAAIESDSRIPLATVSDDRTALENGAVAVDVLAVFIAGLRSDRPDGLFSSVGGDPLPTACLFSSFIHNSCQANLPFTRHLRDLYLCPACILCGVSVR